MFNIGRCLCLLSALFIAACDRQSSCCVRNATEEKPTPPPAEAVEIQPVGPNSSPMLGGSIGRNMANTVDKGIPESWSIEKGKEKNIKWSAKLGSVAFGGPVIAGGRIYVGSNNDSARNPAAAGDKGILMCFRESDGKFLWQIAHEEAPKEWGADHLGILSTPAVEGDRLYYVTGRCELVCADTAGKIVWSLDMMKELKVNPAGLSGTATNSSPLIVGDLVYVLTANGSSADTGKPQNPDAPSLVAVNKKTGKLAWSDHSPGVNIMDGTWSSPVAAEANGEMLVMYGGGDGWIYAFEAKSGELRWKFDCNIKAAVFNGSGRGERCYMVGVPVVHDKKLYAAIGREPDNGDGIGRLWCIDITKKPTKKDKDISPFCAPADPNPKFDPKDPKNADSGLVWQYGGALVPRPAKGREIIFGRSISNCTIHDGLVYAVEIAGFLHCLDAKTGEKYWTQDLQDEIWASPYYVDGKVFLGTKASAMYVLQHGKVFKELAKIEMDNALSVPPVAVNGVLYVTNGTHLYAIAEKK
jgi:outer membrane protein assembly factor BamB